MNVADPRSAAREIARALARSLEPLLGSSATEAEVAAAQDVAQLLALHGLDQVLGVCAGHAGRPWPPELAPALERVRRLTAECSAAGSVEVFLAADRELAAHAAQLLAREWGRPGESFESRHAAVPTLDLAGVLEDHPVAGGRSRDALRTRLTAPVAAALRAALDWLAVEEAAPRPLRLTVEESALEVVCERVNAAGLQPADKVLGFVGANLAPASATGSGAHPPGSWVIRVPAFSPATAYLMLVQGRIQLAIPWHAVLRICMVPAAEVEAGLTSLGLPLLEPLGPLRRATSEHPVALVAHGLKRAYLVADRLVWRLEGEACEPEAASPAPGLSRAVRTAEGEIYWLAEPAWLLDRVAPPAIGAVADPVADDALPVLGSESVEPLPSSAAGTAPPPESRVRTSAPARALVAVHGVGMRAFLARLLEQQGLAVRAVATAAELLAEIDAGPWSLVCVDVELAEERGPRLLGELVARRGEAPAAPPVVALARDAADVAVARTSGVEHTLARPFDREAVIRLLARLGLAQAEPDERDA